MTSKLTPTIGMEIHVELKTNSKMFCGCPADHFRKLPNSQTCPVCLGLPGALPVPNKKAIEWAILIGLALKCKVRKNSTFDRKHYFYPDLPKGYQISQYDDPFCEKGYLTLDSGKKIRITRVHLEEDTAKLQHKTIEGKKVSLIDFNRSGVPLVEIVTEPDINSGSEAKEFLKKLKDIIKSLKVSDCDMEKGSMRLEANTSLTDNPKKLANYKVEVKNLNSFRFVDMAITYEIKRQTKLLNKGKSPVQETRGFNSKLKETYTQRVKETSEDYRYFPEPDIPPISLTNKDIQSIKKLLPILPEQIIQDLKLTFKIPHHTAHLLAVNPDYLNYFNKTLALKSKQLRPSLLASMIINKKINIKATTPKELLKSLKLKKQTTISDSGELLSTITKVIKENPDAVKKFQKGKKSILAFLIGQVMKQTQGKADPKLSQKLLLTHLQGPTLKVN